MALRNWLFIYTSPGLPAEGVVKKVSTDACTTVLAGFPTTSVALEACAGPLRETLASAQLVELCGAFSAAHVGALQALVPASVPIGVVTYTGDMASALHRLFS